MAQSSLALRTLSEGSQRALSNEPWSTEDRLRVQAESPNKLFSNVTEESLRVYI